MDATHDPLRQAPRPARDERGPRGERERLQRADRPDRAPRFDRDARPPRQEREERSDRPARDGGGHRTAGTADRGAAPPRTDFDRSGPRFDRAPQRDRERDAERPSFRNDAERAFDDDRPRERAPRQAPDVGMETFRIEVGHQHGVKPGNIVGAIANEADLESRYIGRIDIRDSFSLIDLPQGMPHEVMEHLRRVRVAGQQLKISRDDGSPPQRGGETERPRRSGPGDGPRRGGPGRPGGFTGRPPRRDR
jgi:ATP-dependent RNA helicase DeaD